MLCSRETNDSFPLLHVQCAMFLPARCGVSVAVSKQPVLPLPVRGLWQDGEHRRLGGCWIRLPKTMAQVSVSRVLRIPCKIGSLFTYLFLCRCSHGYWAERQSLSFHSLCCLLNVAVQILAAVHAAKRPCAFWT